MEQRHVIHTFPAVYDANSKVLILGSVPSVKSMECGFYYMHPQNRFWRIMEAVLGQQLCGVNVDDKKRALTAHGIALYDTVYECDILGSSDGKISNAIPADIQAIIDCGKIEAVLANGSIAYSLVMKYHSDLASVCIKMPSTSPTNATWSFDRLLNEWQNQLKKYI